MEPDATVSRKSIVQLSRELKIRWTTQGNEEILSLYKAGGPQVFPCCNAMPVPQHFVIYHNGS